MKTKILADLQICSSVSLIAKNERFRKSLENGSEYSALLTELSKTFNFLQHDLR